MSEHDPIYTALNQGIVAYFKARKAQIPHFVKTHYRYPGCWYTNRGAFGFDILRAPLNLLWAPIYISLIVLLWCLRVLGWQHAPILARQLPGGITTQVQRHVNQLIQNELFSSAELRRQLIDAVESVPSNTRQPDDQAEIVKGLEDIIDDAMAQLMLTRTAAADIGNTLISTAIGALAFKKFTPGGFGIGLVLATLWVRERAESTFIFGEHLGGWYYRMFPQKPEWFEQAIAVTLVMLVLSVFASLSGLIGDPLQAITGLHQRRLRRMMNQMERDMLTSHGSQFRPLDPYVARILELFDTVKAQLTL